RHPLRRVAQACRSPSGHGAGHPEHGGAAPEDVRGDPRPQARGRGGRLRPDLRGLSRELCRGRQRGPDRPGRRVRGRLPPRAGGHPPGHSGGPRSAVSASHAAIGVLLGLPLFLVMAFGHVAGACGALVAARGRGARLVATAGAIVGGSAGLVLGLDTLIRGTPFQLEIPQVLGLAGGAGLRLHRLGAFFLVLVETVALPAALFGGAYTRIYEEAGALRSLGAMLNLFLLALCLVPFANNVVTFLLFWEAMSVASYFLVLTESEHRETREAALWYFTMAHGGLVLLLAAFLLLAANAPSTAFADLRVAAA